MALVDQVNALAAAVRDKINALSARIDTIPAGPKGDQGDPGQSVTVVYASTDAEFDAAVASAPAHQITVRVP